MDYVATQAWENCWRFAAALLLLAGCLGTPTRAQQSVVDPLAIHDNSFLIEEAYNQDPYVVQHITTFTRFWNSRDLVVSFVQEWPVPKHARHQLSYTLVGMSAGDFPGSGPGWGTSVSTIATRSLEETNQLSPSRPASAFCCPRVRPGSEEVSGGITSPADCRSFRA